LDSDEMRLAIVLMSIFARGAGGLMRKRFSDWQRVGLRIGL
jgi:hypothetical protein